MTDVEFKMDKNTSLGGDASLSGLASIETNNEQGQIFDIIGIPPSESKRNMTLLETISASWIICNSWAGIAATIALAISLGGPTVLIYGPIVVFLIVGCCALTLAELASVYPTAGGQYHWTSILAPKKISKQLSYVCGFANVCSWITISAGIAIIGPQLCLAMAVFYDPNFAPQTWHTFIIYQILNLCVLLYNIFLLKHTLWVHKLAFVVSIVSFLAITISCLSRSSSFQSSELVWNTFINESGWESDGLAFLLGLVSPNYMYAGIDGALHLAEECKNAAVVVPRALMSTIVIGFATSFIFMIAMIYTASDFDAVISTPTGAPIYELWAQATRSRIAPTVFLVLLLLAVIFALNGAQQTASRLTWSFARDDALFGSKKYFGRMDHNLEVPIWALVLNFAVMFIIGCIYLGSSAAFNAVIGCGLTLQHITYAIPAAMLLWRRRSEQVLPRSRSFRVPSQGLGYCVNAVTVFMAAFTLVFYCFPVTMPATGSNMNYAAAVLAVMAVVGYANWLLHARKHYHGPRLESIDADEMSGVN